MEKAANHYGPFRIAECLLVVYSLEDGTLMTGLFHESEIELDEWAYASGPHADIKGGLAAVQDDDLVHIFFNHDQKVWQSTVNVKLGSWVVDKIPLDIPNGTPVSDCGFTIRQNGSLWYTWKVPTLHD